MYAGMHVAIIRDEDDNVTVTYLHVSVALLLVVVVVVVVVFLTAVRVRVTQWREVSTESETSTLTLLHSTTDGLTDWRTGGLTDRSARSKTPCRPLRRPPFVMGRENFFHVEKAANDALHNPNKRGRTHTLDEIETAARVLGRADDGFGNSVGGRRQRRGGGGDRSTPTVVVSKGCVVRVDGKKSERGADEEALRASGALGGKAKRLVLDEDNRWKTKCRILAGGTAGEAALREARRANLGLLKRETREEDEEDEGPMVVPEEELTFVDGWAGQARLPEPVVADAVKEESTIPSDKSVSGNKIEATIGKRKREPRSANCQQTSRGKSREKATPAMLSFDVEDGAC
jgi:hypothetical protein